MVTAATTQVTENVVSRPRDLSRAKPGDLALLAHPVAAELLHSTLPARLAYTARDGTPRVVPILFHWTGEEIILSSWPDDPKVAALRERPQVALTIDTAEAPFKVLSMRGPAEVTMVDGMPAECLPMFTRYMGPEQGRAWVDRMGSMTDRSARIAVRPAWVDVLDFQTRFPSGMTRRMGPA